ncbi:MAG: hypothetical protein JRD89_00750 [Deltaproteobacteria bacterium]|nr:hypothetical protein [Deltaproteobacteria bacterium]
MSRDEKDENKGYATTMDRIRNSKAVTRKILAISTTVVLLYMLIAGIEVPSWFIGQWGAILGFYFGGELGAEQPQRG